MNDFQIQLIIRLLVAILTSITTRDYKPLVGDAEAEINRLRKP